MGERDRNGTQSETEREITVNPFFADFPTYLETALQLKGRGFAVESITFTPHDAMGADVKIIGEDATLVVDVVTFIKTIYPLAKETPPDQVSKSISKISALLANARAKKTSLSSLKKISLYLISLIPLSEGS